MSMFEEMTKRLLKEKRISGFFIQGDAKHSTQEQRNAMESAFEGKTALKGDGYEFQWHEWLVESLFPRTLYQEHGGDLRKLSHDPRIWDIAGFSGNWNNSFGRMARPRETVPEGFLIFMLDRLAGKYGGMPLYYFDVEHPEWVCAPLSGRPDIPKTGRTSVSCVMNYGFHLLDGTLNASVILRHLNWSHGWGDVFGGHALLAAICEESGKKLGRINIFANSATMDEPAIAKQYLKEIGHR